MLIIIDEHALSPLLPTEIHLLFQVMNKRYEKKNIIVTTNSPSRERKLIYGDAVAA